MRTREPSNGESFRYCEAGDCNLPQARKRVGSASAFRALAMLCLAANPTIFQHFSRGRALTDSTSLPSRLASSPSMRLKGNSWQARLDKAVLDVDVMPGPRIRNLQRALRDPAFSRDLRSAVKIIQKKGIAKGHPEVIDKLWPTGTTARVDIEGLAALRKQVPEVLEDLQSLSPSSRTPAVPFFPDPAEVLNSLAKLASDTQAQKDLEEEIKNSLRSTPKGLETPKYKVVRKLVGPLFLGKPEEIELREYPEFTVAKMKMDKFGFGSSSGAEGFNALASYLFGKNEASEAMKMTMPVEISSDGSGAGSMSFILPKEKSDSPPKPSSSSDVAIEAVPARMVAVKSFGGVVTDQEVERQKASLLESLASDGSVVPVDESQISVLQYNSPLTIPWRRRNEIAIVVTDITSEATAEQPTKEISSMEGAETTVEQPTNDISFMKGATAEQPTKEISSMEAADEQLAEKSAAALAENQRVEEEALVDEKAEEFSAIRSDEQQIESSPVVHGEEKQQTEEQEE